MSESGLNQNTNLFEMELPMLMEVQQKLEAAVNQLRNNPRVRRAHLQQ
jgi:hypothetical protein